MGPGPITYEAMDAYGRMTGVPLDPMTVRIVRRIDGAWATAAREK